ncbi:T-complex protein 1 subunit gamma-like [Canna indica]|uniref:T-complex protein 1 subunit gamma-like n=1 Tax=Canna indica TaxID=4628 RepID=A0AAQ3KCZ6_9LILI|nr:T-complex protein 1 subunit gamma-like [Canna indica]
MEAYSEYRGQLGNVRKGVLVVVDIIRTTLGPRSMLKMLLDAAGEAPRSLFNVLLKQILGHNLLEICDFITAAEKKRGKELLNI